MIINGNEYFGVPESCRFRYALTVASSTALNTTINVLSWTNMTTAGQSSFGSSSVNKTLGTITIGRSGIYSLALNLPNTTTALQWAGFLAPSGFVAVNTQVGNTTHLSCQTAYTGWLQAGDVITPQMSYASAVTLPVSNTWFQMTLLNVVS